MSPVSPHRAGVLSRRQSAYVPIHGRWRWDERLPQTVLRVQVSGLQVRTRWPWLLQMVARSQGSQRHTFRSSAKAPPGPKGG